MNEQNEQQVVRVRILQECSVCGPKGLQDALGVVQAGQIVDVTTKGDHASYLLSNGFATLNLSEPEPEPTVAAVVVDDSKASKTAK